MKRKSFAFIALTTAALVLSGAIAAAQPKSSAAKATDSAGVDVLRLLPRSDLVAFINVRNLLNNAVPKVFADNPAKLADFNAEVDKFKTQTGIDARSFENVAVGMLYQFPRAGVTTTDTVVIARGSFSSGALIAAARLATKGKYREEKYGNETIYFFTIQDQVKMLGLMKMKVGEVAAATLDSHTLVIGEPSSVRATLDAGKVAVRPNADLIKLASRTPAALMGFSANVPVELTSSVNIDNPELSKIVGSIRHAYGAISTTEAGFEMLSIARTDKPEEARALSDTIGALKQFGAILAAQLPAAQSKLAQTALDNLKVSATGNEASISLELAQADISALIRILEPKLADAR